MSKIMKTMDGNEAAAYTSYAFTEVAGIFPITPSSPMAEHTDDWAANGKKNIFGQTVKLLKCSPEGGASGTVTRFPCGRLPYNYLYSKSGSSSYDS